MESLEALQRLGALWRRERKAADERSRVAREELPLAERVARGIAARDLTVVDSDAAPGGRVALWLEPKRKDEIELLKAGSGDPVRLWRQSPDSGEAVLGVVARRREGRVSVMVEPEALAVLDEGGSFHLDRDEPTATFDRGDKAIARFREAKAGGDAARLREILFGGAAPGFSEEKEIAFLDPDLNEPQKAAIRHALAARDLALVHGPPGTGKTRTLVEAIRQAIARGERLLVTAASNAAVDHLAGQLVRAGVALVRLGHPARVAPELEPRTLDALLEASGAYENARRWKAEAMEIRRRAAAKRSRGRLDFREERERRREANELFRDARLQLQGEQEAILARMPVVCATCAGADASLLSDARFDTVVIDEATQAPDPIALVALARGARAILAGDPQQLPPTVIDLEAAREGLAVTAFERLSGGAALRMLVVQHRMSEELMAFPSASMYGGKLVAAPQVAKRRLEELPGLEADPTRPGPWHLLDASGRGWTEERGLDDPSTSNPGQAERVAEEARRLLARGLSPADLAIITPYDAQVRRLRELLAAERAAGLEIGTVDGFQGREKEAVIVDTVRSNDGSEIGFLADHRRMNVALTRAKRFLLVVGDGATLGSDPYYAKLLDHAEKTGAWRSAWDP